MKQAKLTARLPWIVSALGVVGLAMRWCLYRVGLDSRMLLGPGHPLEILVWLLTTATALMIILYTRKLRGPNVFEENFFPSQVGTAGCCTAAFLICYTVLSMPAKIPGPPGLAWKVLGVLCAPSLLIAGYGRLTGQKNCYLAFLVPCLFYLFHIITHYRVWSSEAQLQTFFYPLFTSIAMTFFLFYTAAFAVDMPYRRHQLIAGLSGIFLSLVELSRTSYPWLCLAGVILCLTCLCAPIPGTAQTEGGNDHVPA